MKPKTIKQLFKELGDKFWKLEFIPPDNWRAMSEKWETEEGKTPQEALEKLLKEK